MAAVLCLISPISIPAGLSAVTLQTFAVALCGYLLPPRQAVGAALSYLLMGACGLPVFAGLRGGAEILAGPTGGFLAGLPVMALLTSRFGRQTRALRIPAGLAGLAVVYIWGAAHMSAAAGMNFRQALLVGVAPFIVKDAASVAFASWLARAISRRSGGLIREQEKL